MIHYIIFLKSILFSYPLNSNLFLNYLFPCLVLLGGQMGRIYMPMRIGDIYNLPAIVSKVCNICLACSRYSMNIF